MADFWTRFLVPGVVTDYERLFRIQDIARQRGLTRVAADIDLVIADLARGLEHLSVETAAKADVAMRDELQRSLDRPETSSRTHLRERIHSKPLRVRFGEVGIASIDELDKSVNERSDTPYWRAIEFGLSEGFVGRRLVGSFFNPGGPTRPFAGLAGTQAEFQVGGLGEGGQMGLFGDTSGNDDTSGPMIVSKPIKPHRFLERGTETAKISYLRGVTDLSNKAANRLDRIVTRGGRGTTRRRR